MLQAANRAFALSQRHGGLEAGKFQVDGCGMYRALLSPSYFILLGAPA